MEENLEGLFCDIYPREYELKVENYSDHATFLNQDTTIEQGILIFFFFDPIQHGLFRGCSEMVRGGGGGQKGSPP